MNIRHEAGKTQFLLKDGWPTEKADRIAEKYGATVIRYTEPNGHRRHWFEMNNHGQDVRQIAALIEHDLQRGQQHGTS